MSKIMAPLFLLLCVLTVSLCKGDMSEEEKSESNDTRAKINGKTYFFQLRKDTSGNDTAYKKVKEYLNTVDKADVVEFIISGEGKSHPRASENLKNRRGEYTKMEHGKYSYNSHFLDDEWHSSLNNQYAEVPEIAHVLFKNVEEKSSYFNNISVIRFFFEVTPGTDGIVKFDLDPIMNKSDEFIVDAELYIYRRSESNETERDVKHSSEQIVRLYQVLPVNETSEGATQNPDIHKLLNVIFFASYYDGWQISKVKNVVKNWLNGGENLGFLLSTTDAEDNPMPLNIGRKYDGQYQPVLIVYLNTGNRTVSETTTAHALTPDPKQVERYINFSKNTNILPTNSALPCSRQVWYVSFQELGWNNFIIAPSGFMAFRCKGSCVSHLVSPFTNHGRLVNAHHMGFAYLKRPCCVPDALRPLSIMFFDKYQNIVIKTYDGMIAESCACR